MKLTDKDIVAYFDARDKMFTAVRALILKQGLVKSNEEWSFDAYFHDVDDTVSIYLYRDGGTRKDLYEYSLNELLNLEIENN